jgi:hypothetical protein
MPAMMNGQEKPFVFSYTANNNATPRALPKARAVLMVPDPTPLDPLRQ